MSVNLSRGPAFLGAMAYLPRVTVHDGRALEQALAGPDLWQSGVELRGAVVEASFAHSDPPLLRRLSEARVDYIVDPQTLRFASSTFLDVARIEGLPYAPRQAISPTSSDAELEVFIRGALRFQNHHGAAGLLALAPPLYDGEFERWMDLHHRMLRMTISLNGRSGFEQKPLIAYLAPGRRAMKEPEPLIGPLADLPLAGIYVQPLRLIPTRDSIEKLVLYVRLLEKLEALGLPVIAGRVGAFGLVLEAAGVGLFDSGLGEAEAFDFASLTRPRRRTNEGDRGPKGDRRVYLESLKTTLRGRHADAILAQPELRSRFVCNLGCCRFRGFDGFAERRRQHYLWVRHSEVARLAGEPTKAMRLDRVHRQLVEARDSSAVVTRTLADRQLELPNFDHLERWLGVLSRLTEARDRAA
jgi:hypothetical protein